MATFLLSSVFHLVKCNFNSQPGTLHDHPTIFLQCNRTIKESVNFYKTCGFSIVSCHDKTPEDVISHLTGPLQAHFDDPSNKTILGSSDTTDLFHLPKYPSTLQEKPNKEDDNSSFRGSPVANSEAEETHRQQSTRLNKPTSKGLESTGMSS